MPEELKSCRVCKKDVAEYASSCPHCGANHPADLNYSPVATKPDRPVTEAAQSQSIAAKTDASNISIQDAVRNGNVEAVKQHFAAGADVNAKNIGGETPLHFAVANDHKELAELLITKGADVNAKNYRGSTPLHNAASSFGGHEEIAELLVANGAKVNATDHTGKTPLDMADKKEFEEFLRKHGGRGGPRKPKSVTYDYLNRQKSKNVNGGGVFLNSGRADVQDSFGWFGEVLVYFFMPMIVIVGLGLVLTDVVPDLIAGAKDAAVGGIGSLWGWVTENNIHIYLIVIIVLIYGRKELGYACMIVSFLLIFCGGWIGNLIAIPLVILSIIFFVSSDT